MVVFKYIIFFFFIYTVTYVFYTKRYKYFRKMMSNKITRNILFVLIRR